MSEPNILRETASWVDIVDLGLCLFIYDTCNDRQFRHVTGSDFVNFMNLKPTSRPVQTVYKEKLRVCYMVFAVSRSIRPNERGRLWTEAFLKNCGISVDYYNKHRCDVCSDGTTDRNKQYRKDIDRAIENARKLNAIP